MRQSPENREGRRQEMGVHRKMNKSRDDVIEKMIEAARKRMEDPPPDEPPPSSAGAETDAPADKTGGEARQALRPRLKNRRTG